jgi:hypothetical protein
MITAILATHEDPAIASMKLQATINKIDDWAKKWRIKINQTNPRIMHSPHATKHVQHYKWAMLIYPRKMGMHRDRRLTWAKHIKTKRKQLNLRAKQMHWLLKRSTLIKESIPILYKAVLKPIQTYAIQL